MSQGFYGFPNILGLLRGTNLRLTGKAGATAGAGLAGGTTSGAPASGDYDLGDAVIGQDGTLRICTVAGSPGTWVQLGTLVDPLTTRGDLVVRGASATTRLALGATNYVLTSNGTDAVWGVAPAGAGGALTQIQQVRVTSGTAASLAFSSIPGTFSNLQLLVTGRSDNASQQSAYMQFNGDTGAHYDDTFIRNVSTAVSANNSFSANELYIIDAVAASGDTAGLNGSCWVTIHAYADTTFFKTYQSLSYRPFATNGPINTFHTGTWRSTAAITSILVKLDAGNFVAGTVGTLYGLT